MKELILVDHDCTIRNEALEGKQLLCSSQRSPLDSRARAEHADTAISCNS
jgi:hypothetical protein